MISTTAKRNGPADLGYDIKVKQEKRDREIYGTVERNNNINLMEDELDLSSEFELPTEDYSGPDDDSGNLSTIFQGEWPIDKTYWQDGEGSRSSNMEGILQQDTESMMSFSSSTAGSMISHETEIEEKEAAKADVIYSLICMLKTHDKVEVMKMLQTMSNSKENCIAMSRSGCLPLLVQLLHDQTECQTFAAYRQNVELRQRASQILRNIVYSQPDDKKGRREARVLKLLEQVREYCEFLKSSGYEINDNDSARCLDELVPAVAALMKMSFDEEHRHAMCLLGGLQAIAELLEIDEETHGCSTNPCCIMIRRYSGMALTNLTFGDGTNKALLCSMKPFMQALVMQLNSPSEELRQVSASVLRNLSWRADTESKKMLREVGAVSILMKAAIEASKESTLKSILSALWNLSAHCSENKADICGIEGALGFLVTTLTFKSTSKNLAVVENGGGILRNVSSHIALQNDHRITLRQHNCLQILLHHLKSPSLTVVSNACGTLWNLSARNPQDQQTLWEMGAVGMLKKLVNSKHKMISMGSSAALKNLLSAQLPGLNSGLGFSPNDYNNGMPSLHVRKQKMMNTEIDQSLSETYDNTDSPKSSPTYHGSHKKSNTNATKFSSPARNQGIPQRISVKKQNSPPPPQSTIDIDTHIPSSEILQKNSIPTWTSKSNLPRQDGPKVQMRAVSEGRGTAARNFGLNKSGLGESQQKPFVQLIHPSNVRPHSVPCKKDRSCIPSLAFSQPMSGKPVPNRMSDVPSRISSPKTGRKLHINKSNCTNFAQKIGAIKLEDAESEDHSSNLLEKYPEDSSLSSRNLPASSLPNKSTADSRIPLPRLNNYVDDNKHTSGIIPSPMSFVPSKDVRHVSRRESSLKAVPHPNGSPCVDSNQPTVFYNTFPKANQNPVSYQRQAYVYTKQHDLGCEMDESPMAVKESRSNTNFANNGENFGKPNIEKNALNTCRAPLASALSVNDIRTCPTNEDCTSIKEVDASFHNIDSLAQQEPLSNGKEKLYSQNNIPSVPAQEIDCEGKNNVPKTSREMYTHETPLMFSRCSSLGSLSSFDQQSVHGDRSSSSDISQLNSGDVSPSDLPDSPTGCTQDMDPKNGLLTYEQKHGTASNDHDYKEKSIEKTIPKQNVKTPEVALPSPTIVASYENSHAEVQNSIQSNKSNNTQGLSKTSHINNADMCEPTKLKGNVIIQEREPECARARHEEHSSKPVAKPFESPFNEAPTQAAESSSSQYTKKSSGIDDTVVHKPVLQKARQCTDAKNKGYAELKTKKIISKSPELSPAGESTVTVKAAEKNYFKTEEYMGTELSEQLKKLEDENSLTECNTLSQHEIRNLASYNPNEKEIAIKMIKHVLNRPEESMESLPNNCQNSSNDKSQIAMEGMKGFDEKEGIEVHLSTSTSKIKEDPDSTISCDFKEVDNLSDAVNNELKDNNDLCLPDEFSLEAQKFTEDMLEAVVDGTDDMTVSTLSCLSDIDNARPPSIMGDLGSLSLTSSEIFEEANVSKIKKLQFSSNRKTSLLKELQISRLNSDIDMSNSFSKDNKNDLSQSLTNSSSEILEHINPPSLLDDMTFTASTGSLNSLEDNILNNSQFSDEEMKNAETNDNSLNERLCEADVMVQMYTKELSHITGNCLENVDSPDEVHYVVQPNATQAICDALEDLTETACDTIASDVEFVDELPCDDEDLGSETLLAPQLSFLNKDDQGEGSTENLTVTLTEESPFKDEELCLELYEDHLQSVIASEDFEVLRENADLILNTLQNVCLSENSEFEGLASHDMLEDETLSLVSNESDEDSLSPDGVFADSDWSANGLKKHVSEKLSFKKPCMPTPSGVETCAIPNRIPASNQSTERSRFGFSLNTVPSNSKIQNRFQSSAANNQKQSSDRQFTSHQKIPSLDSPTYSDHGSIPDDEAGTTAFDSRTFTKKRPSFGKNIPNISDNFHNTTSYVKNVKPLPNQEYDSNNLEPSNLPSVSSQGEGSPSKIAGQRKAVNSRIACVWKNKPKPKSGDSNKSRTFQ